MNAAPEPSRNPKTLLKALRHIVVERQDGSFRVAGDTGTYIVRNNGYGAYLCTCQAKTRCSHVSAVSFHLSSLRTATATKGK